MVLSLRTTEYDMSGRSFGSVDPGELAPALQRAGLSGAGGGGFPTYVKWKRVDEVHSLLVNHQESEPNCYSDKWLCDEHAEEFAALFDTLLESTLERIVIGAKAVDREPWLRSLEKATGGTVYHPTDLPIDISSESGLVFAYTENTYETGMENVLLQTTTDTVLGKDLPIDYGWVVQNTETVYNMCRALKNDEPVLRKYVHIDGYRSDGSRVPHRMFDAPVGTAVATLLEAAGVDQDSLGEDRVLVDGGPGWCFKIQRPADRYGIRKRTNCVLLLDETTATEHTYGNGRIDVREPLAWSSDAHIKEPEPVDPDRVHVPVVTNETYDELIARSEPTVEFGDLVDKGQVIADPVEEGRGFSVVHHAPISGQVADVTPREVEIRREQR
jgi:Na+-translocating ferredoxin:NAD+ oxidoreductase RnfC subunit